jgi:hypothetical protein
MRRTLRAGVRVDSRPQLAGYLASRSMTSMASSSAMTSTVMVLVIGVLLSYVGRRSTRYRPAPGAEDSAASHPDDQPVTSLARFASIQRNGCKLSPHSGRFTPEPVRHPN